MDNVIVLPDKKGFSPCPELLTAEEAIRFLRLDTLNRESPEDTLKRLCNPRYAENGDKLPRLKTTKLSNHNFFRREALAEFLEKTEIYSSKKP